MKKKVWLNHFEKIDNSVIKITEQVYNNGICYNAIIGGTKISFGYTNGVFWASTEWNPITGSVRQRCRKIWHRKNKSV